MLFDQAEIMAWFASLAYSPALVYGAVALILTASSFGLPIPEEVTLVSVGFLAYTSMRPEQFPPPTPDAVPVNLNLLLLVTFFSVFLADTLVFFIGRFWGNKIRNKARFAKYVNSNAFQKAESWTTKYGAVMSGVFRFTPGLRFPGHMMCGMMGLPLWKFIAVDGTAALLSVPTQVWAVATYGDHILAYFKQIKIVLLILLLLTIIYFLIRRTAFVQKIFPR